MATLREIAKRAGVSIRTVSRALSGAADIRAETRRRVEEIARRLAYRPDPLARGLKLRRGYAVPVIVQQPDELVFAKVCALERELRGAGYTTQLVFNAGGADGEAAHLAEALAGRAAAVVLFNTAQDAPQIEKLHKSGHPYVLIDRTPAPRFDTVHIDRAAGVAGAVGHLLDGGHREVFYLGPSGPDARTAGFARAFRDRDLRPPRECRPGNYNFRTADGRRAARDLAARHPGATAVFACSDQFAYGVLAELAAQGVDVPGKISVIGFDDRSPSQFVAPPLSTVAHPHEEVGKLAAEVLLGKIGGTVKPGEGSRTAVPRFVERQSTRALAASE